MKVQIIKSSNSTDDMHARKMTSDTRFKRVTTTSHSNRLSLRTSFVDCHRTPSTALRVTEKCLCVVSTRSRSTQVHNCQIFLSDRLGSAACCRSLYEEQLLPGHMTVYTSSGSTFLRSFTPRHARHVASRIIVAALRVTCAMGSRKSYSRQGYFVVLRRPTS